ncbi:MAG: NAD(P)-binding protein, partial [Hydrogenophaga sp.]
DAGNREVLSTDVLIVGAGPSGLAAAIRLKQRHPDSAVTVVEKAAGEVFEADQASKSTSPPAGQPWLSAGVKTLLLGALGGGVAAAALFWLWPRTGVPVSTPASPASALQPPAALSATPLPSAGGAAAPSVPADPAAPPVAMPDVAPVGETIAPSSRLPASAALLTNERAGIRGLAGLWNVTLDGSDPCESALRSQLQCFRTNRMTVNGLGQMDRPAALALYLPGEDVRWALLTAIASDSATLRAGEQTWQLPLTVLADIWRGEYATLWRLPPGHEGELRQGDTGPAGDWLRAQFDRLSATQPQYAATLSLTTRIETFQRSQGLETDGIPGPMTFMQLNRIGGMNEPRLKQPAT